ncbi:uncharacterized protein [Drosophila takahashii]|uniref:uncharacterized protein n=1 Tax=Drosophila takahashii TaxID=29030 RepID=UPI001CF91DC0|nr:uncharacterized protein LOC108065470 [Drosophila takahashii]
MQPTPTKKMRSYRLLLLATILLATSFNLANSAPQQAAIPLTWRDLIGALNFPESQEGKPQPQETPEPRDLQQLLLLTSGLSPSQIAQRSSGQGRNFRVPQTTLIVINGTGGSSATPANITNNNTNTVVANNTTPATTTTTGTRTSEFIRAPIGYPAGLPMQYFRKRQDDGSSPAISYPELFGWNPEAAFYGGDLSGYGGGLATYPYAGLGGLNGGYSPLAGVPLVPITVGNEVRYVPLNLRMFRQLARSPAPLPAVREQEDQLEEDDIAGFGLAPELEVEVEPEEEGEQEQEQAGHSTGGGSPGYGLLGQRMRPRPLVRRRPLQSLAQNIRRVQYLRR